MFRLAEKSLGPEIILDVNMIHVDAMFSTRMQKMTNVSLFSFFLDVLNVGMLNLSKMENRPMILIGG